MKLSLVCPCYNEGKNVEAFFDTCVSVLDGNVESYEFIFVNDGSRDDTWQRLLSIYERASCRVKLVRFSRNFGKEAAMYAGLSKAEGEYTTIIDTDLQQRPETVLEMIKILDNEPDTDCVAAYQQKRREGKLMSAAKSMFYRIINKICDIEFRDGASDFRTFRQSVREAVLSLSECHRFMKGIFSWVGFNTCYIPYVAQQRNAGESAWSFNKLLKYAVGGIMSFTSFPLKLAGYTGGALLLASFVYLVLSLLFEAFSAVVFLLLMVGGLQLICLGVLCEYISRMYVQSKARPICVIKEYKEGDVKKDRTAKKEKNN